MNYDSNWCSNFFHRNPNFRKKYQAKKQELLSEGKIFRSSSQNHWSNNINYVKMVKELGEWVDQQIMEKNEIPRNIEIELKAK